MGIPDYILKFVEQVYPESAELALTCFNEKILISDATKLIADLKEEVTDLKAEKGSKDEVTELRNRLIEVEDHCWWAQTHLMDGKRNECLSELRELLQKAKGE